MRIEKQFSIVEKEKGAYHAFPTLIRAAGRVWMACRSGKVSSHQVHGVQGRVLLYASSLENPEQWTLNRVLFQPGNDGSGNELDAVLSHPESDLYFLATRHFQWEKRNETYLSIGQTPALTSRVLLRTMSNQAIICFGHVRRTNKGELLMPGYSGFDDEPSGTPVLLASSDLGRSWQFRSKVASSTKTGTRLTEYSLGHVEGNSWIALIRNETPPFNFYFSFSKDDGRNWAEPQKTDLFGHAPMILDDKELGRHLVLHRDLSESEPGISIGLSEDNGTGWKRAGRLASYTGSIYDGGYGDLVKLEANRYLGVYYLCDEDASPWIDGCIFSIK